VAKVNTYFHAFNVGQHDKTALPRVDLERLRLAAEIQTNLLCMATGRGFMRPGLEYLSSTNANAVTRLKEFVFGATDAALMEFTNGAMRVWVNDQPITRPAVTAQVTNGDFNSATGWTLTATAGASINVASGSLVLTAAARGSMAEASQQVTVNQLFVEHALRIVVGYGPVTFRCGSSAGGDEYISETVLATGTHSLAFTPSTGSFFIQIFSTDRGNRFVDSINVESAGQMLIPTPWGESSLPFMRFAQSADVVFVACSGLPQQRIERRSTRSWSVARYLASDGPFTVDRTAEVKLKPNVVEGTGQLTADAPFFKPSHVGALFRLTHEGQTQTVTLGADEEYTDPIRVTGISNVSGSNNYDDRNWFYTISGTWTGTLRWYRSFDGEDSGFKPFPKSNGAPAGDFDITSNVAGVENDDEDDNQIIWYKLGFGPGLYGSGAATVSVDYDGGGGAGICRVTQYISPTLVAIDVLKSFKNTGFTSNWNEGEWSDAQIWPSAVAFSDGRLWWSGEDRIWGSVSDAFDSFDDTVEGDSGPISRSIATGGVNDTQWLLALQRLIIGTEGAIAVAKSSSLDEPLTPTNMGIRDSSTTGAAPTDAIKVDSRGLFIERAGKAVLELTFDGASSEYLATQLSKLSTDVFESGVRTVAVQRRPDTRIWCVMNDGSCVCIVYEPDQEVLAFIPIETDGAFESVAVLPSLSQDRVYFAVRRTVNGATVRHVEKMALDTEVKPTTLCKVMDAFKVATPAGTLVSGATHLIGRNVVVWADGAPLSGEFTVNGSGQFTLPGSYSSVVYGLPYTARYKSARLAYGAEGGTAMLQKKTVNELGLILTDFVRAGVRYGHSFDDPYRGLYPMPLMVNNKTAEPIILSDVHDEEPFVFPGEWDLDSRVCLEVSSPNTATFLGMVLSVTTNG